MYICNCLFILLRAASKLNSGLEKTPRQYIKLLFNKLNFIIHENCDQDYRLKKHLYKVKVNLPRRKIDLYACNEFRHFLVWEIPELLR